MDEEGPAPETDEEGENDDDDVLPSCWRFRDARKREASGPLGTSDDDDDDEVDEFKENDDIPPFPMGPSLVRGLGLLM